MTRALLVAMVLAVGSATSQEAGNLVAGLRGSAFHSLTIEGIARDFLAALVGVVTLAFSKCTRTEPSSPGSFAKECIANMRDRRSTGLCQGWSRAFTKAILWVLP